MSQDPKLALPRSYQSINKYDGKDRDPNLFKLWDLQVSSSFRKVGPRPPFPFY